MSVFVIESVKRGTTVAKPPNMGVGEWTEYDRKGAFWVHNDVSAVVSTGILGGTPPGSRGRNSFEVETSLVLLSTSLVFLTRVTSSRVPDRGSKETGGDNQADRFGRRKSSKGVGSSRNGGVHYDSVEVAHGHRSC